MSSGRAGPIRVLIADDHAVMRSGLRELLGADVGVEVVGKAADGLETIRLVGALQPDVALLDITMPPDDGIETAKRLEKAFPELVVLFLTVHEDDEPLQAGAAGYLINRAGPDEILHAINAASRGDLYVHPTMTRAPATTDHHRSPSRLRHCGAHAPRGRGPAAAGQGEHQPPGGRAAVPLGADGRKPPGQPAREARRGQPGRARELRRGARADLTALGTPFSMPAGPASGRTGR